MEFLQVFDKNKIALDEKNRKKIKAVFEWWKTFYDNFIIYTKWK